MHNAWHARLLLSRLVENPAEPLRTPQSYLLRGRFSPQLRTLTHPAEHLLTPQKALLRSGTESAEVYPAEARGSPQKKVYSAEVTSAESFQNLEFLKLTGIPQKKQKSAARRGKKMEAAVEIFWTGYYWTPIGPLKGVQSSNGFDRHFVPGVLLNSTFYQGSVVRRMHFDMVKRKMKTELDFIPDRKQLQEMKNTHGFGRVSQTPLYLAYQNV
ncbi:hypothetical protein LXL04_010369 [Taraxacum kok-saghyz]